MEISKRNPTDTERMDWLESMGADLCTPKSDDLMATDRLVHTHFTGWVPGASVRAAIDEAMRRLAEGEK